MKNRLEIARDLLSEDGVIFVQCDDNEQAYLKVLMDEIFERDNFISCISWKRKKEISNDTKNISVQGEYILSFAKTKTTQLFLEQLSSSYIKKSYKEPNKEFPLGKWRPVPLTVSKGLSGGGYKYEITNPNGKKHSRLWALPERSYKKLFLEKSVYFGIDGNGIPQKIMYVKDSKGQPTTNYWDNTSTNKEGKKEFLNLFDDNNIFSNPKPEKLLQRIIHVATKKGDLVLDYHLGSGTTCAVAHKMGRQYIGINKFATPLPVYAFTDTASIKVQTF
jgi:adenine-specific DNA-methyltransferase